MSSDAIIPECTSAQDGLASRQKKEVCVVRVSAYKIYPIQRLELRLIWGALTRPCRAFVRVARLSTRAATLQRNISTRALHTITQSESPTSQPHKVDCAGRGACNTLITIRYYPRMLSSHAGSVWVNQLALAKHGAYIQQIAVTVTRNVKKGCGSRSGAAPTGYKVPISNTRRGVGRSVNLATYFLLQLPGLAGPGSRSCRTCRLPG